MSCLFVLFLVTDVFHAMTGRRLTDSMGAGETVAILGFAALWDAWTIYDTIRGAK